MEADGYTYKVRKKQREVESHDDFKRQSKFTIEPIQPVEEFVSFLNLCPSSTLISEYQDIRSSPQGKKLRLLLSADLVCPQRIWSLLRVIFACADIERGWAIMTINLFFLTLTISKRFKSAEEYEREQQVEEFYNEAKERQLKHFYMNWTDTKG